MNKEKVILLFWNKKNKNNIIYKKQKVKFPKKAPILSNDFIETSGNIVGYGDNFKITKEGIICDISIDSIENLITNSIAPAFKVDDIIIEKEIQYPKGLELFELSFVTKHAFNECENNLK